jgi:hypothetical protein
MRFMAGKNYVVFGGKLKMPGVLEFHNENKLHVIGAYYQYEDAYQAWQSEAYRTIDDAHACYVAKKVTDPLVVSLSEKCTDLASILV